MTDLELVDAERFAAALETIEAGAEPDLDPREDPTLTALASLAAEIRDIERFAAETPRFESYRTRSRAYVLRSIEQPVPAAIEEPRVEESRRHGFPFFLHWRVLAPVASAAAAAVAVLAFVAIEQGSPAAQPEGQQVAAIDSPVDSPELGIEPFESPSSGAPASVEPLPQPSGDSEVVEPGEEELFVAKAIERELGRIDSLIVAVADRVERQQPVEPELLRSIAESIATVAERIEAQPDAVQWQHVISYMQTAGYGRTVLAAASPDSGGAAALAAARQATQNGVVVAGNYFSRFPQ